ncbi:MAG: hypothetical protein AAFP97_06665 [Pseudomonadota bacterium]
MKMSRAQDTQSDGSDALVSETETPVHGWTSAKLGDYLAKKIDKAEFTEEPFRHVTIDDFLPQEIMEEVLRISYVEPQKSVSGIKKQLGDDWKIMPFPGCAKSWTDYRLSRLLGLPLSDPRVDGRGLALRYVGTEPVSALIRNAMTGPAVVSVLKEKLGITRKIVADNGIQKYLDGYEISPHPDPLSKAITILVNMGVGGVETEGSGTRLLKFKASRDYVSQFWKNNNDVAPDWVKWDWCEQVASYDKVNQLLFFAPNEKSLHAVKCDYDHLQSQRSQIYGDFWYVDEVDMGVKHKASYRSLEIQADPTLRDKIRLVRTKKAQKKARTSKDSV